MWQKSIFSVLSFLKAEETPLIYFLSNGATVVHLISTVLKQSAFSDTR